MAHMAVCPPFPFLGLSFINILIFMNINKLNVILKDF